MATLYIVFTATRYKTGGFIRAMTRFGYNHVSVAFDPGLEEVYSFGRIRLHAPFCGGFVREGRERFIVGGERADVSVCAVNVDEDHMLAVRRRIDAMLASDPDRYIYNMASAALVPLRVRAPIRDCYTCIEFAVSILITAGFPIRDRFYSIRDLHMILSGREVYRGEYPGDAPGAGGAYFSAVPVSYGIIQTADSLRRMVMRIGQR